MSEQKRPDLGPAAKSAPADPSEEASEREAQAEDPTSPQRGFEEIEHPEADQQGS